MKISVIVPIYQVELYLRRCIESILNQTYADLELILVDDGSPDQCPQICDEYAKKDDRIKVIHKTNGGLSDARNAGLRIATGEWLAFVDSDDWIEPEMFEYLLNNAQKYDAQISVGGVTDEIITENGTEIIKAMFSDEEEIKCLSPVEAMRKHLNESWAAWDKIYRKDIFENIIYPVGEINEDEAIMLHILDRCQRIVYTNQVFYHYVHRASSITTSAFSEKKLVWCKHCKQNLEWVCEYHPELRQEALRRLLESLLWALREMALSDENFKNAIYYVKNEIIKNYKNFRHLNLETKVKLRLFFNRYFPYNIYKTLERILFRNYIRKAQEEWNE